MKKQLVAYLLLVAPASLCESQAIKRWEVAVSLGRANNRSSEQVKSALIKGGYNDTEICPFDCPPSGARVEAEESWQASLRYAHTARWNSSLVAGGTSQTAYGFRETGFLSGEGLQLREKTRMFAATAVFVAGPLSLEAGPALFRINVEQVAADEADRSSMTKVGALAGARLTAPIRGPVSIHVSTQYRLVGSADVGPFSTPSGSVARQSVSFNQFYFGFGLGLRL